MMTPVCFFKTALAPFLLPARSNTIVHCSFCHCCLGKHSESVNAQGWRPETRSKQEVCSTLHGCSVIAATHVIAALPNPCTYLWTRTCTAMNWFSYWWIILPHEFTTIKIFQGLNYAAYSKSDLKENPEWVVFFIYGISIYTVLSRLMSHHLYLKLKKMTLSRNFWE